MSRPHKLNKEIRLAIALSMLGAFFFGVFVGMGPNHAIGAETQDTYTTHMHKAQEAIKELGITLTLPQEYLLYTAVNELTAAKTLKAQQAYAWGIQAMVDELLRQNILTPSKVQKFTEEAVEYLTLINTKARLLHEETD